MSSRRERIVRALDSLRLLSLFEAHPRWNGVIILNYHRIGDPAGTPLDRGVVSATQDGFDAQLATLARHAELIAPDDLDAALQEKHGRHVMITFDDGYRDNYDLALPVLQRHGAKAAFFICTGFLDDGRMAWWDEIAWMVRASTRRGIPAGSWLPQPIVFDEPDREGAVAALLARYKELPGGEVNGFVSEIAHLTGSGLPPADAVDDLWMTWDMVRELEAAGMEIGGHTVTHPILARMSDARQRIEIQGSQERLTAELGHPVRWFSYPVGSRDAFDEVTAGYLRDFGFEAGFSFYGGFSRPGRITRYDIPRLYVSHETTLEAIAALTILPGIVAMPPPARRSRRRASTVQPRISGADPARV